MDKDTFFLRTAVRACRAAGRIQLSAFGRPQEVEHKGAIDLVTEVDRRAEAAILKILIGTFPEHGYLAEESPPSHRDSEYLWLVDPLDGTTNFSRGFPVFCISVALAYRGEVILGVVFQPLLGELFTARRGRGAFLNGVRQRVTTQDGLGQSFLATGFPYDIRRSRRNNLDHFTRLATRCLAVRRAGAAALDLAYVAAGRFDGFWELKLNSWDLAAGVLLVEEAGGSVTDLSGGPYHLRLRDVVASNGRLHRQLLENLRVRSRPPARSPSPRRERKS
jgi:myo-inositol-1(or 4)-monophosphatase